MSYCFDELPKQEKAAIEKEVISNDMTFDVVSGINTARRTLGSRAAVERHFKEVTVRVEKKLFPKDH